MNVDYAYVSGKVVEIIIDNIIYFTDGSYLVIDYETGHEGTFIVNLEFKEKK